MRLVRFLVIMLLAAGLSFAGCNVIDQLQGKKDKDNTGLFLLAALLAQSSGCKNSSGLVICIPPGLRF